MRFIRARLNSLLTRTGVFTADRGGTAAIEFAVIAPLMITLYLGGVEISDAIAASRKTTLVARTAADLVAQALEIGNSDKDEVLNAAFFVASPYGTGNLTVVISSIKIDNAGAATVKWSDAKNGTARTVGSSVQLDAALAVPNTSLILGEATYNYVPAFGEAITGPISLTDQIYMRPRNGPCVKRNTPSNPSAMNC